jgi:putative mRNA 3-end processing factor
MSAIRATGAERVIVTHGSIGVMVRWLCQNGLDAKAFETEYGGEEEESGAHEAHDAVPSVRPATAGAQEEPVQEPVAEQEGDDA